MGALVIRGFSQPVQAYAVLGNADGGETGDGEG